MNLFSLKQSIVPILLAATLSSFSTVSLSSTEKTAELPSVQTVIEQPVNINSASAEEMSSVLKGIGLKKAEAIVEWRKKHGKFTQIEQLMSISGIGEKTLQRNKALIEL